VVESNLVKSKERVIGIEPTTFSLGSGAPIDEGVVISDTYSDEDLSARYNPSSQDQYQQNATPCEGVPALCDPHLKAIIGDWGKLPQSMREAIHVLVTSSIQGGQS
jgi:hypothetical protein